MIRVKLFTEKVDALNYYQEQEEISIGKVKSHRIVGKAFNCGYGFVVCNSKETAQTIMQQFQSSIEKNYMGCKEWELQPAPAPRDILWENMGSMPKLTFALKWMWTILFVILFMVVLSPPTVLALINTLLDTLGVTDLVAALLFQYLPSLVIFLYQRVLVPEVIKFMANREQHLTNSGVMKSRLEKYLLFNVIFAFIVPLLGLQAVDLIITFVKEDVSLWNERFAERLENTGQLFTIYIIHLAFLSNGFDLLQLMRIVRLRINLRGKITEQEKMRAYKPDRFNFGYHYAMSLTALLIVLSFSIVYPLIIPFGLLYFCIKVSASQYFTHKYNMLCFYYVDQVTSGDIGRYALNYFNAFILFFQLVTVGLLMLEGSKGLIIAGGVFITVSLVVFIMFLLFGERLCQVPIEPTYLEDPEITILYKEAIEYRHPVDRNSLWEQPIA
jgi:hypothetical protein